MRIVKRKGLLQLGIVAGSLLAMSWATPSPQAGQSKATGKAAPAQAGHPATAAKKKDDVDWNIFLPEGEGKFQTSVYCTNCHNLQVVVAGKRADESEWTTVVKTMVTQNGAAIEDEDVAAISKYLGQAFGPSVPKLELPIHINTAPKETLTLLALSPTDIQNIIDARTKEKLQDFAALEAVVGSDKLAKYKSTISFD